jgi:lipopolysaccharide transport system ATP-binding protein
MEMTGRENIYISGSVMGATLSEIKEKFDEITAFAELERFIDTPLKFYSKGMNSRLGFSVCIHLVKEVLLLDEVIFAGDMAFRVKCVDKVKSVANDVGRTVLVVSHSNSIIQQLCERTLLLNNGTVQALGPSKKVIEEYDTMFSVSRQPKSVSSPMEGSEAPEEVIPAEYKKNGAPEVPVSLQRVAIMGDSGAIANEFDVSQMVSILIEYQVAEELYGSRVGLAVKSENGIVSLTSSDTDLEPDIFKIRPAGLYQTKLTIPKRWLGPGRYRVHVLIYNEYENRVYDEVEAVGFRLKSLRAQTFMDNEVGRGVIEPVLQWNTQMDK